MKHLSTFTGPDELLPAESIVSWDAETPVKLRISDSGLLALRPVSVMTAMSQIVDKFPNHDALGELLQHFGRILCHMLQEPWKCILLYMLYIDSYGQRTASLPFIQNENYIGCFMLKLTQVRRSSQCNIMISSSSFRILTYLNDTLA